MINKHSLENYSHVHLFLPATFQVINFRKRRMVLIIYLDEVWALQFKPQDHLNSCIYVFDKLFFKIIIIVKKNCKLSNKISTISEPYASLSLNGTFSTSDALTFDCYTQYIGEFRTSYQNIIAYINDHLDTMCPYTSGMSVVGGDVNMFNNANSASALFAGHTIVIIS